MKKIFSLATACLAVLTAAVPVRSADLASQMPILAPRAIAWAQKAEAAALESGAPLGPRLEELARAVGVAQPGRVRIVVVERVPMPDEPMLRTAAAAVGLSQATASGMTLGHAIFVRAGEEADARLLSHELRHVAQYEQAGGIAGFLAKHLVDLASHGYEDAPFEVDARAHERAELPPARS